MGKYNYSDLLQSLDGFDAWLTKLGLTSNQSDRIHQAFKILRKAEEASRRGRETGIYTDIHPRDWFAITEALEACDVFCAFHNDISSVIAEKLKRALSGPLQPIHETQKNRDGRNTWFELALAAEWRLRGASVAAEEPDLCLTRDNLKFLVACKRPANERRIDANIRDAIKQIQRTLDKAPRGAFGIAAISLNCVFNPGDKVFSGGTNELNMLLENEFAKRERQLLSVDDPRICCVLFHVATPSLGGEDVDLMRISHALAWDLNRASIGSSTFKKHAQEVRSGPKKSWKLDEIATPWSSQGQQ